jgi:hypothetical protein
MINMINIIKIIKIIKVKTHTLLYAYARAHVALNNQITGYKLQLGNIQRLRLSGEIVDFIKQQPVD